MPRARAANWSVRYSLATTTPATGPLGDRRIGHRRANEITTRRELFDDSRFGGARRRALGQTIRRGARVLPRQRRRGNVDDRRHRRPAVRTGGEPIDFHEIDALLAHVRRNDLANLGGARGQIHRGKRARKSLGLRRDQSLLLSVVVAGNRVGRRQHHVHRLVEPAIHARANQLAAHDQHEHGRDDGHAEQDRRRAWS